MVHCHWDAFARREVFDFFMGFGIQKWNSKCNFDWTYCEKGFLSCVESQVFSNFVPVFLSSISHIYRYEFELWNGIFVLLIFEYEYPEEDENYMFGNNIFHLESLILIKNI